MAIEGASNLYFSAANSVASQQAQKAKKNENLEKANKVKRKTFSSAIEKAKEEFALEQEGLPKEIAGLDTEEAAIYLKDQADMAADVLKEHQTPKEFADYRKKVSQFLKYVTKNNFEIKKRERRGFSKSGKPLNPQYKIVVINQKLDEMAKWLLSTHKETFNMLERIDELKGLIVDIMAS